MKLKSLLQYVDEYLGVGAHPDYPTALNGLQVDGPETVTTIATAVDASLASIEAAADLGADLLIVHHGLFWGGLEPIVGRHYRRIEALIRSGVALYSCHLPLDSHPEVGNCALLARALGLNLQGRLGTYKGHDLGWWGALPAPTDLDGLTRIVSSGTGDSQLRAIPGGPDRIESVGVLTGGGGSFIADAARCGLDAFVTGEGTHHSFFDATEYGIHVLFAGHYATETFGVRALGDHLADRFDLTVSFLDHPTGL